MTKRDAQKIKIGDTLIQLHNGCAVPFVVTRIETEHADPRVAVPLFYGESEPTGITYKLVTQVKGGN